uniref:Uncharacterized protein n=1 Tax=Brassica oleracea TaxID=3712 RepID=A0A3P6FLT2_BRAOL|nr:unnamed protein product [Brassica oleracea]
MSMRSAKSFGKSYVAVYFTNISAGTVESELGFRLIQMATHNSKYTASLFFSHSYSCPGKPMAAETGVRFCILLSLTWMGGIILFVKVCC